MGIINKENFKSKMKQSLFAVVAIAALAQAKLPAQITEYEN